MNPPTLPERPSLPQALNNVHPGRTVAMRVAAAASRGLPDGPTPTRSPLNVRDEDGRTEPMHMPASAWRPEPFQLDPHRGGCVHCFHGESAHCRGKDTPIRCTVTDCDCAGFKGLWTLRDTVSAVFTVLVWLAAFAVILGVAAVFIGAGR